MDAFLCNQMNRHPSDVNIPPGMNRETKFKWFLGQFEVSDQRRVLEELCGPDDRAQRRRGPGEDVYIEVVGSGLF